MAIDYRKYDWGMIGGKAKYFLKQRLDGWMHTRSEQHEAYASELPTYFALSAPSRRVCSSKHPGIL